MKTAQSSEGQVKNARLKLHEGKALMRLAATYPTLHKVILEQIQNGIDQGAKKIKVAVNLLKRTLVVCDDGSGASERKFNAALVSVCNTMKKDGDLGQFGIGLISGLGKCKCFTFTSCEAGNESAGYRRWTFSTDMIQEMEQVSIPSAKQNHLVFRPDIAGNENECGKLQKHGFNPVWWRAKMSFSGLSKDRQVSRFSFAELRDSILSNFGAKMKKTGTSVTVGFVDEKGESSGDKDIVASAYEGTEIPEHVIRDDSVGEVTFRLFVSRIVDGRRCGKVHVSVLGDDFRVNCNKFLRQCEGQINPDVEEALSSGYFEGDIIGEKIVLHANREGFENNDALIGLGLAMEEWFAKVGSGYFEANRDLEKHKRYQECGLVAMEEMGEILKNPENGDIVSRLKIGSIGPGHTDVKTIGVENVSTLSVQGGVLTPREPGNSDGTKVTVPENEIPGHKPGTVAGPRGRRRLIVRGGSVGLSFHFEQMLSAFDIFSFDAKTGVLTFNTNHEYWGKCEANKISHTRYMVTVAQIALSLSRYEEEITYEAQKAVMLRFLEMAVHSIVNSTAQLRRFREIGRKKK